MPTPCRRLAPASAGKLRRRKDPTNDPAKAAPARRGRCEMRWMIFASAALICGIQSAIADRKGVAEDPSLQSEGLSKKDKIYSEDGICGKAEVDSEAKVRGRLFPPPTNRHFFPYSVRGATSLDTGGHETELLRTGPDWNGDRPDEGLPSSCAPPNAAGCAV